MIYVIQTGDTGHGWAVRGASTTPAGALRLAREADAYYHRCYGGDPCVVTTATFRHGSHLRVTVHEDAGATA